MKPRVHGPGHMPCYGNGWMHQFGHVYALQHELLAGGRQNWFRAIELWHCARDENLALNSVHYTHILRQCVAPAQWEAALAVLRQMRREAIRPDAVGVGCALAACSDAGQWEATLRTFRFHHEVQRMQLDSVCCEAVQVACARAGRWADVLWLAAAQAEDGVPVVAARHEAALLAAAHRGAASDADAALIPVALRLATGRRMAHAAAEAPALPLPVDCDAEGALVLRPPLAKRRLPPPRSGSPPRVVDRR